MFLPEMTKEGYKVASPVIVNDLRDLDQGKLILPRDYETFTPFGPLEDAWRIFIRETFEYMEKQEEISVIDTTKYYGS